MRESAALASGPASRGLHAGEEGMLSLASLFVVVGFLALIGLLANAGLVASRKLETQNAADSVAYSASVEMARGMNAVTAINHLIGELTALVVLIHTLGGDELDQGRQPPATPASRQIPLEIAYETAWTLGQDSVPVWDDAYTEASPDPQVGGAIYDARMRLKLVLTWAFEVHFIGSVIAQGQFIPIVGPALEAIGDSISWLAWAFEFKVWEECETLDFLEDLAHALQPAKVAIRDGVIPVLHGYQYAVVFAAPLNADRAADAMAAPNLATVAHYPFFPLLQLPVTTKPDEQSSTEKSQLMRASTPWIQWWRQAWIDFGKNALLLSRFAAAYESRSTAYTLSIVKKQREEKGINLYVLDKLDLNGAGKTHEPWTTSAGSGEADRMFCIMGFAHRPAPRPWGHFFRQENPDGMVCYAQAMLYNPNAQERGSGNGDWQPTAGWDTLNWDDAAPEYPGPVPPGDDTPTPTTPQPRIRLNWRSKLVPSTRLTEATLFQRGAIGRVLWRTHSELPLSRTH